MRNADDDQPGPVDSKAFVESMLDQAFAAVAGLEIHPAAQRLAEIAMRFEQGLIEQFNFTAEEAHNSARQFLTRALDEITRAMREEVLRSKLRRCADRARGASACDRSHVSPSIFS